MYILESSCSPGCNKLEHDRPRHDRPAARVIAQQYSAPTFTSQCGHSCKEKFFAHFENVVSTFYFFLNRLIHGVSECPLLVLNSLTTLSIPHITKRWLTVCSGVVIGMLATLRTGQLSNLLIPGGQTAFLSSPHCADRLWGPPILLLSGCRDFLEGKAAESRTWTFSKLLVTTMGFEQAASQMRIRYTSDAVSLNKVNNKNPIALCSYCTAVHMLTMQCSWLFYVAPVCNIKKFSALLTKCTAVISECQHKGAIIPLHRATLSDSLVEAPVCLLSCTNWMFKYHSGYSSFLKM